MSGANPGQETFSVLYLRQLSEVRFGHVVSAAVPVWLSSPVLGGL